MSDPITVSLIGIGGVILGVILTEWLRKRSRIEAFSSLVYEKKLNIYEELFNKINASTELINETINNTELSKDEKFEIESAVVLDICQFTDKHQLYLNDEVIVQCCTLFMNTHNINAPVEDEPERTLEHLNEQLLNTKNIIRSETGVEKVNKLFSSITKAKHSSPVIEYMRALKKKKGNK